MRYKILMYVVKLELLIPFLHTYTFLEESQKRKLHPKWIIYE